MNFPKRFVVQERGEDHAHTASLYDLASPCRGSSSGMAFSRVRPQLSGVNYLYRSAQGERMGLSPKSSMKIPGVFTKLWNRRT